MKKFLSLTLCVLCAGFTFAQDSYRYKLKQFFASDQSMEQAKQLLSQNATAEQLDSLQATLNMVDELLELMVDAVEPSVRKYMSEADLDWMINWNNSSQTKAINAKSMNLAQQVLQGDPAMMEAITEFGTAITAITQNEKPSDIKKADVSKKYRKNFHTYYTESGAGEMINNMFGAIPKMLEGLAGESQEAMDMLNKMMKYINDNMEELMLRMLKDILTDEDLQYYSNSMNQPAYQHYRQAMLDVFSDPADFVQKIMNYFESHTEQKTETEATLL